MNATYILLLFTVFVALFNKEKRVIYFNIVVTIIVALQQEVINAEGFASLVVVSILAYVYFNYKNIHRVLKWLLFIILFAFIIGFSYHIVPGFFNILVLNKVKASELSLPFSMYLNFDKVMATVILTL